MSEDTRMFSRYGIVSALLAVVCATVIALLGVIWVRHHGEVAERTRQTEAMQTAVDWTGVLINMNADNVEQSLAKLRDGTVGELNTDFEAAVQPYREVVQKLRAHTTGRVESAAIAPAAPGPDQGLPPGMTQHTDTVLVVATSVSENAGGQPQTVRWNLRLGVSEVDGRMLVSRLESLR